MWEALALWIVFGILLSQVIQFLRLLFTLCFGIAILMWIALFNLCTLLYNLAAAIFYPVGYTANYALPLLCKPFAAAATFLARLATLTITVLTTSSAMDNLLHSGLMASYLLA